MKFLRPNTDTKLEGYILGYGSSMFSKQFIQLPENGQPYETEFGMKQEKIVLMHLNEQRLREHTLYVLHVFRC